MVFSAGALWGVIGPLMRVMSDAGSSSALTSFLRMAFAFLIMLPLTLLKSGPKSLRVSPRTLLACALLGLICHGVYNVFYAVAVTTAGVTTSAVLLDVAPVFGLGVSAVLFHEHVTPLKIAAVLVDVVGCVLVVTGGNFSQASFSVVGVLCGLGAGLTYALTAPIGKLASSDADSFVVSTYSYLFASLFVFVYLRPWSQPVELNGTILGAGFVLALVPTAIAYVLYYYGVERIEENGKVPVIASIETVVAALFGVLAYHEELGLAGLAGIVMVLASVAMMSSSGRSRAERPRKRHQD
jgi:DME family drug/metabolite transporter